MSNMIIESALYLIFAVIALSVLGIFGHVIIAIAGHFEEKEENRERRAEIRKKFKREVNDLRADDGVYSEVIEVKGA